MDIDLKQVHKLLKDCPFCGSRPRLEHTIFPLSIPYVGMVKKGQSRVRCECGVYTEYSDSLAETVKRWNRRIT